MNKIRFFVAIVLTLVFLTGCRNVKKQPVETNDRIKTVTVPKVVDAESVDILYDLEYIILEAKENSYFGFVSKMRVYQDRIYILDDRHAKMLSIYTIEGKHIANIGDKKGRGPLEFIDIANFEIDYVNNQILAIDAFGCKFMIYDLDGNFIKRVDSRLPVFNAVLLPNGYFLHAKPTWEYRISGQSNCQIIITDDKKQIVKEGFEYDDNKNMNIHIGDVIRAQSDGGFNFAPKFRDTIYSVSFESIIPKYAIDYGNNGKIPKSTLDGLDSSMDLYKLFKDGRNMCFMGVHVESNDLLYLTLGSGIVNPVYVFYNKQTNNTLAISRKANITEYRYELYDIYCSDDEGYFYGVFNFADADELIKLFPEMQKFDAVEDMNSILFRYKVKI